MKKKGWTLTKVSDDDGYVLDNSTFHYRLKDVIHAIREEDNGYQAKQMYDAHLKIRAHCGHWMIPYGMMRNDTGRLVWNLELCLAKKVRPCGACYGWPYVQEYERRKRE